MLALKKRKTPCCALTNDSGLKKVLLGAQVWISSNWEDAEESVICHDLRTEDQLKKYKTLAGILGSDHWEMFLFLYFQIKSQCFIF